SVAGRLDGGNALAGIDDDVFDHVGGKERIGRGCGLRAVTDAETARGIRNQPKLPGFGTERIGGGHAAVECDRLRGADTGGCVFWKEGHLRGPSRGRRNASEWTSRTRLRASARSHRPR